jgi:hypothetical protein
VKPVVATLTSLVILAIGWLVIAFLLSLIAILASEARSGIGLLHLINAFLVWVLSPGVGGFFAVYVTSLLFWSVSTQTIYVSFVSVTAVVLVILFLLGVLSVRLGGSSYVDLALFILQGAAIFPGARVGKAAVDDVRPATSTL